MRLPPAAWMLLPLLIFTAVAGAAEVTIAVDPSRIVGHVDQKVYGHFLEHIYHSVNGGLWGEMVWARSFEEGTSSINWSVDGGVLAQRGHGENARLLFGDATWKDYEYTLDARKIDGDEGFLIIFRAASDDDFYWYNLGGWSNTRHALERGVNGEGRWHTIEPGRPGSIETGKWYHIRVRCDGPHFEVYLDGVKLLDFSDRTHPHLAGRVGVGTWHTSAEFRNFKVVSLDGKVIWSGLPAAAEPTVAERWTPYGKGEFRWTSEHPLNGDYCQMIAPAGDEAGVQQSPFCIRQGETYRGSLWARGTAAHIVVRLLSGVKVLAAAMLSAPDEQWREYPFILKPTAEEDQAVLQIGVLGKGRVWIDQVSMMSDAARRTGGFRSDLLQAVKALQPPLIRWPGGCFAEYYLWKDAIGPQVKRVQYPRIIWDDRDVNSFGTDEFIALCRKVGAEPLLVINTGRHMPPDHRAEMIRNARDWVEYCNGPATSPWGRLRAANGHSKPYHVKYWEIDNETWSMGAERYAETVREFVPALKQVDPTIQVAVCGSGGMNLNWNRDILAACAPWIDFLSIHHYENPDRFADGPRQYERFFADTAKLIAASANPRMRIFVSEWNAQSTDWRTGLYAGGLLNAFERSDAVAIASPALFLRHVSATGWDNAFINFDNCRWFPAPNYVVMKLYREHYAPDRVAIDGDTGVLNAVATVTADGKTLCLKAVNPTDQPVDVALRIEGRFTKAKARLQLIAPDSLSARNTLDKPDVVRVTNSRVQFDGTTAHFAMPRWSVAVVTIAH